MATFYPKALKDDDWMTLEKGKAFAVRISQEEDVRVRLGSGVGLYLCFAISKSGGLEVRNVDYETAEASNPTSLLMDTNITLGRTEDCQFKIKHAIVSRKHLEIKATGNILLLRELGSTNGSSVYKGQTYFDVDAYLANHPLDQQQSATLDSVHEHFGPTLDDFLTKYLKEQKK